LIPAYYSLVFSLDDEMIDFKMSTNNKDMGDFDDVVMEIELKNGEQHVFALQLKHIVRPIAQIHLVTNNKKFSLKKYSKEFIAVKTNYNKSRSYNAPFQNFHFILFSNSVLEKHEEIDENWTRLEPIADGKKINSDLLIRQFDDYFEKKFLNLGETDNGINFKLKCVQNDSPDKEFFQQFSFYTRQKHAKELEALIADTILKTFKYCSTSVVINYLKYFDQWCRRDYGCLKLTKTDVRVKLAELLLTSHIQFPNLEELTTVPEEQSSLVLELCGIFDMIPLEKPPEIVLNKIWTIILKHCKTIYSCSKSTTFSDLNNDLLKKNIELPLSAFGEAFDQIALKRFYVMLWHTGLVPLIVKIAKDTPEHEHILQAVKLCENKLNTKKFILVDNYSFEGINDWKIFRNLTDLTSFTDLYGSLIKQLSISLQGRESIFLKQFVEIDKRVSENITMEEIILMLDGNFVVGSDCKKNFPKYYSTRQIPKVLLSTKLFDEVDDLFVVSYSETTESVDTQFNINVIDVNKYLFLKQNENVSNYNPKQFKFSYLQKIQQNNQDINDKFLILTRSGCTEEQLEKISFRNPLKNCHYVRFLDKEKVEWIESRGGIQKIQKYRLDSVEFKSDDFVKDVDALTHFSNKINLICSEPGMGKSVMMQFLKMQYSSDFWILSINLGEQSEFFKQKHNVKDILNYFLENEEVNSFGRKTAEIYFSKKQIIFLWDGFDELPGVCADSVIDSVKNLASEGYSQWLSARSDLRGNLESAFTTLCLSLTQFSEQDQLYYILRHLNEKYDPIKSLQIATKMSENISAYLNCGYFDYTGIPLLIHMFVEIYLRTPEDQMNDVLIITLTDMYDEFIRTRFNILFERAEADSENYYMRQIQEQYLDSQLPLYEIAAVKASFEEELFQRLNLNCDELVNEVEESEDSLGLIVRINDHGKPVFTHKTYEEFLTASWLSKYYKDHLNLLVVLFQENHRNIRFMFDMILAKDSPVHLAVLYRNLEILKLHEAQIKHCRDSGGRSALHLACSWGSIYPPVKAIRNDTQEVDLASETITIRINSPIKSYEQDTLSLPIINFLLNKNCDILEEDHYLKWNSFHYADQALFVGAIDLMLEQVHIDREFLVNYNHIPTLVHYAAFSCLNELFELIDEIPYMKYNLEFIKINLLEVAANSNNLFAVCRILEYTIYKNVLKLESDVASSTLSSAVRFGNVQMLSVLLENGAKVNGHKKPPLIVAVVENSLQCFEKLLRAGANVDELSDEGHSALVASARFNRQEFAKLLLENGADINHTGTDLTALDCAIQHSPQLVPFLVQYKPDLNQQSKKLGLTSLHVASEVGNPDIIKYLLEHGADAKIKSKQLLTPLHVALANGKRENALVLIEADLSVIDEPCQNDEGYLVTPVLLAANKNFPDIVGILCEYGVDVDSTQCTTSPLHTASYHGFDSCIVKLIEAGASVNRLDTQGESPLFCSVNHLTTLQVLLQNSADVNIKNQWGVTALHEAANVGKIESAEELIKAGANVNAKDNANRTSLFYSIEKKHYEMAKLLLDSGSTVDDGGELLCRAARSDFPDGISLLLERGVNVDAKDSRGKSALHDASLGGNSCVEALLKAGANPNLLDHSNLTPLMCSIISSKSDATERLIKSGAALNPRRDCRTPLHLACCFGDIFSTILLIKYGADVNASDEYGLTPLHHVSGNNQTAMLLQELLKEKSQDDEKIYISYNGEDCAKELLDNGANVNQKNSMGYVPLHVACTDKISNLVKLFVEYGADVNALNSMNQSPLHICFSLGNVEDADILLENGADLDIVDLFGKTPLEYVMDRMHLEGETNLTVLEKLVKLRANIVLPDDTESMKLHKVCFEGNTEMVRSLLDNGADPEGNSFEGIPPIFYACVGNHKETVGILLERRCQVNVYDDAEGVSPLILAVLSSVEDIIKLLLSSYTSIQADAGSALLRTACSLGMINKCKILLEAGVQTDRGDNRGETKSSHLQLVIFFNCRLHSAALRHH
jgi:ankyrin repeat protein